MRRICKSIQAIGQEANKYVLQGDEEGAYIMYMKYFTLITMVQKRRDFEQKKKLLRAVLGSNNALNRHMDLVAKLKESLKRR